MIAQMNSATINRPTNGVINPININTNAVNTIPRTISLSNTNNVLILLPSLFLTCYFKLKWLVCNHIVLILNRAIAVFDIVKLLNIMLTRMNMT